MFYTNGKKREDGKKGEDLRNNMRVLGKLANFESKMPCVGHHLGVNNLWFVP